MHSNEQIRVRGLNRVTQPTPSEKRLFLLRDCFALVYEGLEDFVVEVMSFIKLIKVLSVCIPVTRVTMVGEFDTLGLYNTAIARCVARSRNFGIKNVFSRAKNHSISNLHKNSFWSQRQISQNSSEFKFRTLIHTQKQS